MVKVTVEVPENMYRFLKAYAEFIGVSVEEILESEVQRIPELILGSLTCPYVEADDLKRKYKLETHESEE